MAQDHKLKLLCLSFSTGLFTPLLEKTFITVASKSLQNDKYLRMNYKVVQRHNE